MRCQWQAVATAQTPARLQCKTIPCITTETACIGPACAKACNNPFIALKSSGRVLLRLPAMLLLRNHHRQNRTCSG